MLEATMEEDDIDRERPTEPTRRTLANGIAVPPSFAGFCFVPTALETVASLVAPTVAPHVVWMESGPSVIVTCRADDFIRAITCQVLELGAAIPQGVVGVAFEIRSRRDGEWVVVETELVMPAEPRRVLERTAQSLADGVASASLLRACLQRAGGRLLAPQELVLSTCFLCAADDTTDQA